MGTHRAACLCTRSDRLRGGCHPELVLGACARTDRRQMSCGGWNVGKLPRPMGHWMHGGMCLWPFGSRLLVHIVYSSFDLVWRTVGNCLDPRVLLSAWRNAPVASWHMLALSNLYILLMLFCCSRRGCLTPSLQTLLRPAGYGS